MCSSDLLTIRRLLEEQPVIRVVDDQRGRPTSAQHLVQVSQALLLAGARGTWHATDGQDCTWYEFACEIADRLGSAGSVEPCTSEEFSRPARRPAYSVLDISATESLVGPMPPWRVNLGTVLAQLNQRAKGVATGLDTPGETRL